jgi:hypothetical protein
LNFKGERVSGWVVKKKKRKSYIGGDGEPVGQHLRAMLRKKMGQELALASEAAKAQQLPQPP